MIVMANHRGHDALSSNRQLKRIMKVMLLWIEDQGFYFRVHSITAFQPIRECQCTLFVCESNVVAYTKWSGVNRE